MCASRSLTLARTMRWATVDGAVRKARAISSVVRPQTSRNVSAICASGGRAGWQQVKINRSRSSSTLSSSQEAASLVSVSSRRASSASDASNRAGRRDLRGHLEGVVQIAGVDEVESAQLLLRLGEGTVGGGQLAVPDPHGRGRVNRLERLPRDVVAALADPLGEGVVLAHEGVRLALGHGAQLLLLIVDQAKVLHRSLPNRGGTAVDAR